MSMSGTRSTRSTHPHIGYLFIDARSVPGEARPRCPARRSHIGCPRLTVWLSFCLRAPDTAGRERLKEGFALLEAAVPSRLENG